MPALGALGGPEASSARWRSTLSSSLRAVLPKKLEVKTDLITVRVPELKKAILRDIYIIARFLGVEMSAKETFLQRCTRTYETTLVIASQLRY